MDRGRVSTKDGSLPTFTTSSTCFCLGWACEKMKKFLNKTVLNEQFVFWLFKVESEALTTFDGQRDDGSDGHALQ